MVLTIAVLTIGSSLARSVAQAFDINALTDGLIPSLHVAVAVLGNSSCVRSLTDSLVPTDQLRTDSLWTATLNGWQSLDLVRNILLICDSRQLWQGCLTLDFVTFVNVLNVACVLQIGTHSRMDTISSLYCVVLTTYAYATRSASSAAPVAALVLVVVGFRPRLAAVDRAGVLPAINKRHSRDLITFVVRILVASLYQLLFSLLQAERTHQALTIA